LILIILKKSAFFEDAIKFHFHNFSIAKGCAGNKKMAPNFCFNRRTGGTQFSPVVGAAAEKWKKMKRCSAAEKGNSRDKKKLSQAAGYTLSSGAQFLPKRGALMLQKYFNKTHRVLHLAKKSVSCLRVRERERGAGGVARHWLRQTNFNYIPRRGREDN